MLRWKLFIILFRCINHLYFNTHWNIITWIWLWLFPLNVRWKKRIAGYNISICGDNNSSLCTDGAQLYQMLKTDDDFMKLLSFYSNKKWTDSFNYWWIGSVNQFSYLFFASLMWQFAAFTVYVFVNWICFPRFGLQIWFKELLSHFELEEVIYRWIDNFGLCDGRRCLQTPHHLITRG